MVISVEINSNKIAYMPVPKVASSSIKIALTDMADNISAHVDINHSDEVHTVLPTQRFRPHRWKEYSDHWGFTVVRDPWHRLRSVYLDRVVKRQELHHSRRLRKTDFPLAPDADFFFQNIHEYRDLSSVVKHHALPVWLYTGTDLSRFDYVYCVENLDLLEKDMTQKTGKEMCIGRVNTTEETLSFKDLKPKTRNVVQDYLEAEYSFLKDYYEMPVAC